MRRSYGRYGALAPVQRPGRLLVLCDGITPKRPNRHAGQAEPGDDRGATHRCERDRRGAMTTSTERNRDGGNALVRVAGASNGAEAEFVRNLLEQEGVPSLMRRAPAFDVPEMLAAGARDVLVPASAVEAVRQILLQAETTPPPNGAVDRATPWHAGLGLLGGGVAFVGAVVWLGTYLAF